MTDPAAVHRVLSYRADLLRVLRDEPMERHVLVDQVAASKSTVYKGVTQLLELDLVESSDTGLRLTLFGQVALARYEELVRATGLGPLLADLPAGAIDPAALLGAEAVVPDDTDVNRVQTRVEGLLREATGLRGFSPAISPAYIATIYDRLENADFSLQFVLPGDLVEFLRSERAEPLADVLGYPAATLYRTSEDLSLTLLLLDTPDSQQVCIEVGEDAGATGLVLNDTDTACWWAQRTFARVRADADLVTPPPDAPDHE